MSDEPYEFEATPLVPTETVKVRFIDIGELPPMDLSDESEAPMPDPTSVLFRCPVCRNTHIEPGYCSDCGEPVEPVNNPTPDIAATLAELDRLHALKANGKDGELFVDANAYTLLVYPTLRAHIATLTAEIAALKANAAKPAKAETQNSAAKPRYFKPRRESPVFASLAPQKIQDGKSYRFNRDGPFVGWRYNLTEVGPDLMAALAENFVEVPTESEATAGF